MAPRKNKNLRKNPAAPKRFKSSYILFSIHYRKEVVDAMMKDGDDKKKKWPHLVTQKLTEKWKALPAEERKYWEAKSVQDWERYKTEKENFNGPWHIQADAIKKPKRKKDPSAPKRHPSAFLFFSRERRKILLKENPQCSNAGISKMLGKEWSEMSDEVKQPFRDRELVERSNYHDRKRDWKLSGILSNEMSRILGDLGTDEVEMQGVSKEEDDFPDLEERIKRLVEHNDSSDDDSSEDDYSPIAVSSPPTISTLKPCQNGPTKDAIPPSTPSGNILTPEKKSHLPSWTSVHAQREKSHLPSWTSVHARREQLRNTKMVNSPEGSAHAQTLAHFPELKNAAHENIHMPAPAAQHPNSSYGQSGHIHRQLLPPPEPRYIPRKDHMHAPAKHTNSSNNQHEHINQQALAPPEHTNMPDKHATMPSLAQHSNSPNNQNGFICRPTLAPPEPTYIPGKHRMLAPAMDTNSPNNQHGHIHQSAVTFHEHTNISDKHVHMPAPAQHLNSLNNQHGHIHQKAHAPPEPTNFPGKHHMPTPAQHPNSLNNQHGHIHQKAHAPPEPTNFPGKHHMPPPAHHPNSPNNQNGHINQQALAPPEHTNIPDKHAFMPPPAQHPNSSNKKHGHINQQALPPPEHSNILDKHAPMPALAQHPNSLNNQHGHINQPALLNNRRPPYHPGQYWHHPMKGPYHFRPPYPQKYCFRRHSIPPHYPGPPMMQMPYPPYHRPGGHYHPSFRPAK